MSDEAGVRIGIDIGGTFTDVICTGGGATHILKVPSTRGNPSLAVRTALEQIRARYGIDPGNIVRFVHGTTVATNAVIERKGARVGVVTTEGFRDVLELGRQIRTQLYDLKLEPETPGWLAPGARRVEVKERIAADGTVIVPLDLDSVERAVAALRAQNVDSVAVSLLFSFQNRAHEQAVREYIARVAPGLAVSLSSEVDPAFREYERTVVTAFDAYIKPIVDVYLAAMSDYLSMEGVPAPLQVMQSRGGLAGTETARQRPVRLFLSGPAAGALGGAAAGRDAGLEDLITIDVGGTSSDIALIQNGRALVRPETDVAGYTVRVPMLDVTTLGAGGGSIAWIDTGGGLRVGPHSAGADPGPACYDRGGRDPTVTDASVVLGYLDPDYFAGGSLRLRAELAFDVIRERVAQPLGMTVEAAALGIHRIANAHMADGMRLVSVNRGYDPREFVLVPLGGAGGVHAAALADELDMRRILVPRFPGVLSASGLLAAPIEHEVARAFHKPLADVDMGELKCALASIDERAQKLMQSEAVEGLRHEIHHFADVGYLGQSHFLEVALDTRQADGVRRLYADFETLHERVNGLKTGAPAKIVNLRTVHRAHLPESKMVGTLAATAGCSEKGRRSVLFAGDTVGRDSGIHDRSLIATGEKIEGPAIIEQEDTTTLVPPGWRAVCMSGAALIVERISGS